jgi:predicted metal-dependent peptidase
MQPFLAMALYALTPVADSMTPTFGVDDRWRLYVNPAKLREWTVPQIAGVLLHEVSHVVRDHSGRARTASAAGDQATASLWNLAADAEINDDLLAAQVELPANPVTPALLSMPPEKVAEFYYAGLVHAQEPPLVEGPDCGSGCHGQGSRGDQAMMVPLPAGLSETEAMLLRRRIAEAVSVVAPGQPGLIPGGWIRWAEAVVRPQLDWRHLLAAKIRSSTAAVAGSADYSYSRPPRRRVPRVVLPSLQRPVPRVAIIIDTSGSMVDHQLRSAWTEVHGCLRTLGIRRDMLTSTQQMQRFTGLPAR